jgi:hypothetical protein
MMGDICIIATMNAFTNNSLPIQDEVFKAKFAKKSIGVGLEF